MQIESLPTHEPRPLGVGGTTRVLVIDGDAGARARAELHCGGSRDLLVATAESVDAALAANAEADVIFLEVSADDHLSRLPAQLDQLRAHRPCPAAIAITSPHDNLQFRVAAARAGADLFLVQPVGKHAMRDAIRHFERRRHTLARRVLVVDDDSEYVEQAQEILTQAGYLAVGLTDSASLLENLRRLHPDAVLLHLGMPLYDGIAITSMLRNSPEFSTTPVLLVSGNRDPDMIRRAFGAGANDFMIRPIHADDFIARLDALIERSRQLRSAAERDTLTGLLNRSPFYAALDNRVASSLRNRTPMCLCLIDLDHFKRINDSHGHQAGDEVLATFGQLVRDSFRDEDLKCRWGGEEFVLAFPTEYDTAVVHRLVERLLARFSAISFRAASGALFAVTFSAGIARMAPDVGDTDGLIKLADHRLYQAKETGRSCVVSEL